MTTPAVAAVAAGAIFERAGHETCHIPSDLHRRPGWPDWASRGDVQMWHHATDADEPFSVFARQDDASIGFHFGTLAAARERHRIMYRMTDEPDGWMVTTLVRTSNPLRMRDKFCWDMRQVTTELISRGIVDDDREEEILESCDTQALFAAIEAAGHDAIVYSNETEGVHDGNQDSILVWRASQIRSIHAASFIEGDPRLCPTLHMRVEEGHWWTENERGLERWLTRFRRTGQLLPGECLPE